jgi:hypothetical protein
MRPSVDQRHRATQRLISAAGMVAVAATLSLFPELALGQATTGDFPIPTVSSLPTI